MFLLNLFLLLQVNNYWRFFGRVCDLALCINMSVQFNDVIENQGIEIVIKSINIRNTLFCRVSIRFKLDKGIPPYMAR